MKGIIFITFIFTSLLTTSLSEEHARYHHDSITYLLRLQWLPGQCKAFGDNCTESKVVNSWTIHGLWTDTYCDKKKIPDHPFRKDILLKSESISELRKYWVDIKEKDQDKNFTFWRREFNKHGCVTDWKELEYFNKALSVYKQYNPENKLRKAGITPGGSYNQEKFQNVFDTFVLLKCNDDNSINELQFCLDKEFNAVNCRMKHRCSDKDILYMKKNEESIHSIKMKRRVSW